MGFCGVLSHVKFGPNVARGTLFDRHTLMASTLYVERYQALDNPLVPEVSGRQL